MAKTPHKTKLSDEIRTAIENAGVTRYRIHKETGIAQPTLTRFMSGERGLPTKTLDVLAKYLDLHIVVGTQAKKGK